MSRRALRAPTLPPALLATAQIALAGHRLPRSRVWVCHRCAPRR